MPSLIKRLGRVEPLPLGVEIPEGRLLPAERAGLAAPSALERARTALGVHRRLGSSDDDGGGGSFTAPENPASGYLLTRDPEANPPHSGLTPTLDALLVASRALSEVLLDGAPAADVRPRYDAHWGTLHEVPLDAEGDRAPSSDMVVRTEGEAGAPSSALDDPVLREVVAARLASAVEKSAGLPRTLLERVREVEDLLDTAILPPGLGADDDGSRLDAILVADARVCFTGTVHDAAGRFVDKWELERLVAQLGLRWAPGVSKTRCDVLVVAEVGTQSGKARKAKEYGKPVISAEEFYDWVARQ